ncbi:hypothetical protein [Corynebacterium jeddahense]|uniref:Uncharacterized protein n=1 Tax=Corynebacterium jeddahense TaxID=1414719 RepID=A0ABY7UKE5_9CORY|nr:hypothetical protein [Corynebacterium jeddahense]WCZ38144.1 hypothetical protein CJEDD_02615 [Corynebacterium jeddahense]
MTTISPKPKRRANSSSVKRDQGKIAAAKLIIKRNDEGKGKVVITQRIRDLADS